jgi:hypothetical protein
MTPASILTALKSILESSQYLTGYVPSGNVFLGVREGITIFPCLVVEPVGDRLLDENFANEGRALGINIYFYTQVYDKEKQIVGDTNTKGVLDIENDIRKAISADITLGLAEVYDTRILSSVQDINQFPIRGFVINIEVHYKQNRLTRA